MIISENREKVKKKAIGLIYQLKSELSKPVRKFVLEMSMGMLLSGSCNINLITGLLKEGIDPRHTIKRLHRMLLNCQILKYANQLSLKESLSKINDKTILALDGGDISHQYGKKFDKMATIRDGSSKELRPGYWLNQVSGYNPSTRHTFPILLDIYSTLEKGFKSSNVETFKIVDKVVDKVDNKGLWVIDRGYDGGEVLNHFLSKGLHFMLRMNKSRNLIFKGRKVNIYKLSRQINRRVNFDNRARFGSRKVLIEVMKNLYEVTLISFKNKKSKEPILFLANGWIKSTKELKRRIRGYFYRWTVEDSFRFEKQGFGIEKSKTRNYKRIKTLIGLTIISWLILIKIHEHGKLRETILKAARMEKNKVKDRPKFIYYRLLRGVQRIFEGIEKLFRFRLKRKHKKEVKKRWLKDYPLFKNMNVIDDYLEDVA